jgi:hypothetical protein
MALWEGNAEHHAGFQIRLQAALERVRLLLDHERQVRPAAEVPHRYADKFALAQLLCQNYIAALLNCLEVLGVSAEQVAEMKEWSLVRTVTLRLAATHSCLFVKKETRYVLASVNSFGDEVGTRDVESDTKSVSKSTFFGLRYCST